MACQVRLVRRSHATSLCTRVLVLPGRGRSEQFWISWRGTVLHRQLTAQSVNSFSVLSRSRTLAITLRIVMTVFLPFGAPT